MITWAVHRYLHKCHNLVLHNTVHELCSTGKDSNVYPTITCYKYSVLGQFSNFKLEPGLFLFLNEEFLTPTTCTLVIQVICPYQRILYVLSTTWEYRSIALFCKHQYRSHNDSNQVCSNWNIITLEATPPPIGMEFVDHETRTNLRRKQYQNVSHSNQDACAGYTLIYLSKYEVPELFLHPATFRVWRREGELCYTVPVEVVLWYWTRRKVSIQDSL